MYDVARPPVESKALERDCGCLGKVEWRRSRFLFLLCFGSFILYFSFSFFSFFLQFSSAAGVVEKRDQGRVGVGRAKSEKPKVSLSAACDLIAKCARVRRRGIQREKQIRRPAGIS